MFKHLKFFIPVAIAFLTMGSMCQPEPEPEPGNEYSCDASGLYYRVDNGQEVFLPQGTGAALMVYYEHRSQSPGNFLMVHQLGNGYIFQSSATDVNQTSAQVSMPDITEGSKLDIVSLWNNQSPVSLQFVCKRLDDQQGGRVYYEFSGTFDDDQSVQHTIEGHLCVKIDEIR